jgi:hypothetical protein
VTTAAAVTALFWVGGFLVGLGVGLIASLR